MYNVIYYHIFFIFFKFIKTNIQYIDLFCCMLLYFDLFSKRIFKVFIFSSGYI